MTEKNANVLFSPRGLMVPMEWKEMLFSLDSETCAALIRAALQYCECAQVPDLKPKAVPLWLVMKPAIDEQIRRAKKTSEGRKSAALARWQTADNKPDRHNRPDRQDRGNNAECKCMQMHANAFSEMQMHANASTAGAYAPDVRECGTVQTVQNNFKNEKEKLTKRKEKDFDLFGKKKPERPERIKAVLMYYLRKHYHRRKSTRWSEAELRKLRDVSLRPEVLRELRTIGLAYRGGYEYARHDIVTLLNNWTVELDRAENFNKTKGGRNGGGIGKRYGMQ